MRDKNEVAVVNLKTHAIAALWAPPGLTKPVPMVLDQKHHLLFVGGRKPGKLFVLDSDTGALLQTLDSCDVSDSMWFDSANNMLYVSGHTGLSIYRVTGRRAAPVATIDNKAGKSSLLVKQLKRLYVAQPKTAAQRAELRIYRVR